MPEKKAPGPLPEKFFRNQQAWENWLAKNGESKGGIWLKIAKKSARKRSVTYLEALDVALCYGWIDGLKKSFDEETFIQKFTPRRAKSLWSKINRTKAIALIEAGRMKPPGFAAIESAKSDGRWDSAYDSYRTSEVPDDLQRELDANPKAKEFFATLSRQNRYAILFRLQTARTPETRQKRLGEFIEMLENHRKLHPQL